MKPGRELDALVAEKVMGLRLTSGREGYFPGPPDRRVRGKARNVPSFSVDIAAAWQVLDTMRRKGYESVVQWSLEGCAVWVRQYEIDELHAPPDAAVPGGDEAVPHAICLAALKAVGVAV